MIINKKEVESVIKLSAAKRYDYFIKKVADTTKIWGLYSNGWALSGDIELNKILPLWPDKVYAELCANSEWDGYVAESIDVHDFIEKYIESLELDSIKIAIFYTPEDKGAIIPHKNLKEDLKGALQEVE
jgi:hypothetical protein